MSDSHDDTTGQGPGSTGDASTSPGSSKPGVKTAQQTSATPPPPPPAKKAPAQKAAAKKPAQKSAPKAPAQKSAQKAPAKKTATAPAASEQDTVVQPAARPSTAQPGPGSGRPLTAADYATTTRGSAASTSVMPAIRDEPAPGPAPAAAAGSSRSARLRLKHIEPWSVTRLAFVVSVALMIVAVVAVTIFWIVLDLTGVWDQLNGSVTNVLSDDSGNFDVTDYLGLGRLVGLTLVLSAVNVIVMTALATIAAHLYNLAAQLLGGVELTFGED